MIFNRLISLTKYKLLAVFWLITLCSYAQKKPLPNADLKAQSAFTFVLLPDVQNYSKFKRNQPILDIMMNWILASKDSLNTKLVLSTGDLVEHDNIINPDGLKMDQTGKQQWQFVAQAFGKLDGQLPYVTATGNHDYNIFSYTHSPKQTHFFEYFYPEKNKLNQALLREVAANIYGQPSLENAVYEWQSPNGKPFLIMSVEFAPRDTVLNWAKQTLAQKKYANHTVILLTHSFLNYKNERIESEKYDLPGANYGQAIWDKLIKSSPNIQLVISGHIGAKDDARKHVAYRKDKNMAGKTVHQLTFNAQAMGGGHYGNGGDGWLRTLSFSADGKTIAVKTFSPLFAISPSTAKLSWRRADYDEYTIQLD